MKKIFQVFFDVHLCLPVGVRRNFFRGGKTAFCLSVSVADDATQIDMHKTLYPFYAIKKMPNATATVANSVPSKKIYTEQMFVLVSMNILILKTELAEF